MPLNILISGAGVASPVLAYYLLAADPHHKITILERSPSLRTTGQSIDIRQSAVDIIRRMELLQSVRDRSTHEAGIEFVDWTGKPFAIFAATGDANRQGFTSEFEIFRGDLVNLLFDKIQGRVDVVYDDYVTSYQINHSASNPTVTVTTSNSRLSNTTFDLLVASDGQSSRIRNMLLDIPNPRDLYYPFWNYAAYFTITDSSPLGFDKDEKMAKWYNTTGGRAIFIRPDTRPGHCRANLIRQLLPGDTAMNERYRSALSRGNDAVKQVIREDFADAGWVADQVLEAMDTTEDFYASETAQIRTNRVVGHGVVALLGDAAYCPSPLSGMGTSLAIIGAYVLAGEISRAVAGDDKDSAGISRALDQYQGIMLPYAKSVMNVPRIVPRILNPQSGWAVWLVKTIVTLVYRSGIAGLLSRLAGSPALQGKSWEPPAYQWPGM